MPICGVIKARQFFVSPSREIQTVEMSRRPFAIISAPDYLDFDISAYLEIKQKEKVNAECYCSYSEGYETMTGKKKKENRRNSKVELLVICVNALCQMLEMRRKNNSELFFRIDFPWVLVHLTYRPTKSEN